MDCRQAQEIVARRHDPGLRDATEIDEALEHCEACPECAAFARAVATLDAIPRPEAPERAVSSALQAVERERASDMAAAEAALAEPVEPPPSKGRRLTVDIAIPRPAVIASAAVVFVAAVLVTVSVMTSGLPEAEQAGDQTLTADEPSAVAPLELSEESAGASGEGESDAAADDGEDRAADAAPPYVQFEGRVYSVAPELNDVEVLPTPAGSVSTAKAPDGSVTAYSVYQDGGGDYYLEGEQEGAFAPLDLVTRTYEARTYALSTDRAITEYGIWPTLPTYVPEPLQPNGSPIFAEVGQDAHGAVVYVRLGQTAERGIAVAPDTPRTDPAAGNPNWTWWVPTSN
jgi:hypothetical protein